MMVQENKKCFAFTLAEVLLGLTIIGVITALILPTFTADMHGKANKTKFLKTISVLTQASTASFANDNYDFSGASGYYGDVNSPKETYHLVDGAEDGSTVGYNTEPYMGDGTHSDLHIESNSIFHLLLNNTKLKHSSEVVNYGVGAIDLKNNCASHVADGTSIEINPIGTPAITSATIKNNLNERMYKQDSVVQGSGGLASLCDGRTLAQGGINQGRMLMFEDGVVFTYDPSQAFCYETNPCYGYIDVNGPEGPNRVISCTEGKDSFISTYGNNAPAGMLLTDCTVKTSDITDIFPVLFYNQTVKPASWAAKSVQYNLVTNQKEN